MSLVWVVEDEKDYQFMYKEILGVRYELQFFDDLTEFRKAMKNIKISPTLIVADLRLPDESFFNFLRTEGTPIPSEIPFIVVSSMDDIDILNECFARGASDYLTKPFNARELTVKVDRCIKSYSKNTYLTAKGYSLNPLNFSLCENGRPIAQFTPKEYHIFSIIAGATSQGMSKVDLINQLWGPSKVSNNTLDVHICNIRKKIGNRAITVVSGPGDYIKVGFESDRPNLGNRVNQGA